MKSRLITGVLGALFLVLVTYFHGTLFNFTFFVIESIALYELERVVTKKLNILYKMNYLVALIIFICSLLKIEINIFLIIIIYTILTGLIYVIDSKLNFHDITTSYFGLLYIVLLLYHVTLFKSNIHIWLIYIITFSSDSFAYIFGVTLGKHKLCPELSPKKTIEGAVGGVIGAILMSVAFNIFVLHESMSIIILIASIGSIASIFGDLVASKIKREYHIKDYGNILPGHGGILDRFDSFIIVAPITYYMVLFLI